MARVVAPGGRVALSAWIPEGAIATAMRHSREAVAAATGAQPGPPPSPWHEREALAGLLGRHGFSVALRERSLAFRGASPRQWFEEELRIHPVRVAMDAALDENALAEVARRSLEIFEAANEDPSAFQVTSRYVVATATRDD